MDTINGERVSANMIVHNFMFFVEKMGCHVLNFPSPSFSKITVSHSMHPRRHVTKRINIDRNPFYLMDSVVVEEYAIIPSLYNCI